jgi:hypothetical protein
MFGQRPFDLALRPDGRRAIMPFFFGGNLGVLDLDTQAHFTRQKPVGDRLVGIAARSAALPLDGYGWPLGRKVGGVTVADVAVERRLYPKAAAYAQTGRLAVVAHGGTTISGGATESDTQLGSISLIDDMRISEALEARWEQTKDQGGYLGRWPLDEDGITQPVFSIVGEELRSPQGVAVTPIVAFLSPLSGDVLWRTAPVMVWWRIPSGRASEIELEARDEKSGDSVGPPVKKSLRGLNVARVSFQELVNDATAKAACSGPTGPSRQLRLTARLKNRTETLAEASVRVQFSCGG